MGFNSAEVLAEKISPISPNKSDNSDKATITTTVIDSSNLAVEGVKVTFSATAGMLQVVEDYLDDEDVWELYRAFDFGLNLGVGYQVKSVLFNVGYSFGLTNLTPKYDADDYDMDEDYTENVIQKNRGA